MKSVVVVMYCCCAGWGGSGAGPTNGPSKIIPDGLTVPKGLAKPDALLKAAGTDWVSMESAGEMRFKAAGEGALFDLMPMWEIRDQKYGVYWQTGSGKKQAEQVHCAPFIRRPIDVSVAEWSGSPMSGSED